MREDWSGITDEKRARLFPIIHEEHNPRWQDSYAQEQIFLQSVFGGKLVRISHIGSTAVPGLLAKPTIDILLEIAKDTDIPPITERLLERGYAVNNPPDDLIMYIKGYTPRGFEGQAMHIHVRHSGDWGELYFRDYLTLYPGVAREYEILKRELKKQHPYDRDGYTKAKGEFVNMYTEQARREFPGRYTPAV